MNCSAIRIPVSRNPVQTTLGWDQYNQTVSYSFGSNAVPYLNFGSQNVGATGPWVLTEVRERPQTTTNKFKNAELNVHFKATDHVNLSAGVQFKEYDFATTSLRLVNGETVTATNVYAPLRAVPIASYGQTLNYLNGAGVSVPAGSTTVWANAQRVCGARALSGSTRTAVSSPSAPRATSETTCPSGSRISAATCR